MKYNCYGYRLGDIIYIQSVDALSMIVRVGESMQILNSFHVVKRCPIKGDLSFNMEEIRLASEDEKEMYFDMLRNFAI